MEMVIGAAAGEKKRETCPRLAQKWRQIVKKIAPIATTDKDPTEEKNN